MNKLETIDNKTYIYDDKTGWTEKETGNPAPESVLKLLTTKTPSRAMNNKKVEKEEVKPKKIGRPKKTTADYKKDLDNAKEDLDKAKEEYLRLENEGKNSTEAKSKMRDLNSQFKKVKDRYYWKMSPEERAQYREDNRKSPIEIIYQKKNSSEARNRDPIIVPKDNDPKSLEPFVYGVFGDVVRNSNYISDDYLDGNDAIPETLETEIKTSVEEMVHELAKIDEGLKSQLNQNEDAASVDEEEHAEDHAISLYDPKSLSSSGILASLGIAALAATIFNPVQLAIDGLKALGDKLSEWYDQFTGWINDKIERTNNYIRTSISDANKYIKNKYDAINTILEDSKFKDEWKTTKKAGNWTIDKTSKFLDGWVNIGNWASSKTSDFASAAWEVAKIEWGSGSISNPIIPSASAAENQSYNTNSGTFISPIKGSENSITSGYGKRNAPKKGASTNHKGIDIAAPVGTPVKSPMDGKVHRIFNQKGKAGKVLDLVHPGGYKTRYFHLSGYNVKKGDKVSAGQVVAFSGNTGNSTGPHLHFELIKDGKQLDPSKFIGKSKPKDSRAANRKKITEEAKEEARDFAEEPTIEKVPSLISKSAAALFTNIKGLVEVDSYYKGSIEEITKRNRNKEIDMKAAKKYAKKMKIKKKPKTEIPQLPNLNKKPGTIHTHSEANDSWVPNQYIEYFELSS